MDAQAKEIKTKSCVRLIHSSNKNVVWVEKSLRYKPDFVIKNS
jgi:hypothetical protein